MSTLKESDIQRACCDLLDAHKIPWTRRNVGTMSGSHKGKRWFVRYGRKGEADIEAWPVRTTLWLEIKRPDGKQSDDQKEFQKWAESIGHTYLLIRDVDELAKWLREV